MTYESHQRQSFEIENLLTDAVKQPVDFESIINLDRLCRTVHMLNYLPVTHFDGVLLLEVDPRHIFGKNTHPFTREQWESFWTFAHNGQLSGYEELFKPGKHRPVGDTDSEAAFCWLLNELDQKYPRKPANMKAMFQYAVELCGRLNDFGIFNLLLSVGRALSAGLLQHEPVLDHAACAVRQSPAH